MRPFKEPEGATPLNAEDFAGLRLNTVATRGDLNAAEEANILKGLAWAGRRRGLPLLSEDFVLALHKRMFGDVWTWAGTYRTRQTNIGVAPHSVRPALRELLADIAYWRANLTYGADESAVRLHHRMVAIHPFPNGNGRHTRLMADLAIQEWGGAAFTWGRGALGATSAARTQYMIALRAADAHDIGPLLAFSRS